MLSIFRRNFLDASRSYKDIPVYTNKPNVVVITVLRISFWWTDTWWETDDKLNFENIFLPYSIDVKVLILHTWYRFTFVNKLNCQSLRMGVYALSKFGLMCDLLFIYAFTPQCSPLIVGYSLRTDKRKNKQESKWNKYLCIRIYTWLFVSKFRVRQFIT